MIQFAHLVSDANKEVVQLYDNINYLKKRVSIYQYAQPGPSMWPWAWDAAPINKGESILEFGCGWGGFWQENSKLIPDDCSITLTDISMNMLAACKQNTAALTGKANVSYQIADIELMPFYGQSFDRVMCHFVLFYTKNPFAALQAIKKVLKPGGLATIFIMHSKSNQKLYELAHEVDNRFPNKDIMLEQFCEENAEPVLDKIFPDRTKHIYERTIKLPLGADVRPFLESMSEAYKIEIDTKTKGDYQYRVEEAIIANKPNGLEFISRAALYVCKNDN